MKKQTPVEQARQNIIARRQNGDPDDPRQVLREVHALHKPQTKPEPETRPEPQQRSETDAFLDRAFKYGEVRDQAIRNLEARGESRSNSKALLREMDKLLRERHPAQTKEGVSRNSKQEIA